MKTKLEKKHRLAIFPAGIIEGIEGFWHAGEKWVMVEGTKMKFEAAPGNVQRMFADAFMNDCRSQLYLKRHGVTKFSEGFEWWFKCVVGAYDCEADFLNGKFTPDSFNNTCTEIDCVHRGKLCGLASGLNASDVKTLAALKQGETLRNTAAMLYVSVPGMKSRITRLRIITETKNTAALTARAAEFGIR